MRWSWVWPTRGRKSWNRRDEEREERRKMMHRVLTFFLCKLMQQTRLPDSHITCRQRGAVNIPGHMTSRVRVKWNRVFDPLLFRPSLVTLEETERYSLIWIICAFDRLRTWLDDFMLTDSFCEEDEWVNEQRCGSLRVNRRANTARPGRLICGMFRLCDNQFS